MKKRIKKWIDIIGKKNMIAISALVLVLVLGVVFAVKSNRKDDDELVAQEESIGLQVQENADDVEGDSIDFSEFLSEDEKDEDKKENTNKNEASSNNSGLSVSENESGSNANSVDFNEVSKEEEPAKLDVKIDEKSKEGYIIKDDSDFSHLTSEVKAVINTIKEAIKEQKTPAISEEIQPLLKDKISVSDKVYDIQPEDGQKKDKDGYYVVDLLVKDVSKSYKKVVVLHYSEVRELWEVIEPTKVDGDVITVKFKDLSPVIVLGEPIEVAEEEDKKEEDKKEEDKKEDNKPNNNTSTGAEFGAFF